MLAASNKEFYFALVGGECLAVLSIWISLARRQVHVEVIAPSREFDDRWFELTPNIDLSVLLNENFQRYVRRSMGLQVVDLLVFWLIQHFRQHQTSVLQRI